MLDRSAKSGDELVSAEMFGIETFDANEIWLAGWLAGWSTRRGDWVWRLRMSGVVV